MKTFEMIDFPIWLGIGIVMLMAANGYGDVAVIIAYCTIGFLFATFAWNVIVWRMRRRQHMIETFNRVWSQ